MLFRTIGFSDQSFIALEQAVNLAAIWMEMQTKTPPSDPTLLVMRRDLKRILIHRIANDLVQAGW